MTVCGECRGPIEGDDYVERHDDGELEYHQECCPHPTCRVLFGPARVG